MKKNVLSLFAVLVLLSFAVSACSAYSLTPAATESAGAASAETTIDAPAETSASESAAASESEAADDGDSAEKGEDFVGTIEEIKEDGDTGNVRLKAADFSLVDQNGERHNFKDYAGKLVVLNFWQTWCPPCRAEMPDFQKVFEKYGENKEDVVILGVASPKNDEQKEYTQEAMNDSQIKEFLENGEYSYPSLMDYTGALYKTHQIMSFPTSFIIGRDGMILGRIPGAIGEEQLSSLLDDFLAADK